MRYLIAASLLVFVGFVPRAAAQEAMTDLAKQTQNPVADLVTLPFHFNFNTGGDLEDATLFNMNFQPVIPFRLTSNWNMIARTIVPVVSIPGPQGLRYSGIGDIQEQLFISPARPGRLVWGVGPQLSVPVATTLPVQTGSWAVGPSVVALTMQGPWVVGGLMNNVWTVADSGDPTEVNQFLFQPFVNFNFGAGWALTTAPIITANWDAEGDNRWTVPLGMGIVRTTVFNGRPMTIGAQYYRNLARRPVPMPTRCGCPSRSCIRSVDSSYGVPDDFMESTPMLMTSYRSSPLALLLSLALAIPPGTLGAD